MGLQWDWIGGIAMELDPIGSYHGWDCNGIGSHHGWDCNEIDLVGLQWYWILLAQIMDGIAMGLVHIMDGIAMGLTWWDAMGLDPIGSNQGAWWDYHVIGSH